MVVVIQAVAKPSRQTFNDVHDGLHGLRVLSDG